MQIVVGAFMAGHPFKYVFIECVFLSRESFAFYSPSRILRLRRQIVKGQVAGQVLGDRCQVSVVSEFLNQTFKRCGCQKIAEKSF